MPALSLSYRIHSVENGLPVKGWFKWSEKTLVDRIGHYKVPGVSIAIINSDEIEWAKGYGTLEVGNNKSVTSDTLFQSGSIGKSLTAAVHKVNGHQAAGKWHNLACFGAGGGLWTTPTDLARFGIEISKAYKGKSDKIVSQKFAEIMLTPQTGTGNFGRRVSKLLPSFCSQIKYGLGIILCDEGDDFIFWHGGHNLPGYRSLLVVMPEKEQGIVIMINGEKGAMLTAEIFYSFAQAYGWIRR